MSKEKYEILSKRYAAEGQLNYCLAVFGDHLAKREGYKAVDGMDAVHFYLMTKHHWLPRDVKSMSQEDLTFALREELEGWSLPPEARA
jgi:hypothetical protein